MNNDFSYYKMRFKFRKEIKSTSDNFFNRDKHDLHTFIVFMFLVLCADIMK